MYLGNIRIMDVSLGEEKMVSAYLGEELIWSSSRPVTYFVDTGLSYTEKVKYKHDCLSPTTFTPTKTGYTFVGWREDTNPNSNVLTEKIVETKPLTLYAVFKKEIKLTLYNGSTSSKTLSDQQYYNNGNYLNPKFTQSQSTLSGWSARGWSSSSAANPTIEFSSINNTEFSANKTLYGLYEKSVTLSYNGNGSTSGSVTSQSGTAYYNSSGNIVNVSFKLSANGFAKSGYTFDKWAMGSTSGTQYAVGATVTLSQSTVFYVVWLTNPFYAKLTEPEWVLTNYNQYSHSYDYTVSDEKVEIWSRKNESDPGMVEQARYSLTGTFNTKGCKKVTLKGFGYHFDNSDHADPYDGMDVNGVEIKHNKNFSLTFDCPNSTFNVILFVNDATAYFKATITLTQVYFHN